MIPPQSKIDPYDLVDIRYYNLILKWKYSASLTLLEVLKKFVIPILNVSRKFSMCIIFSTGYIKIYNINFFE